MQTRACALRFEIPTGNRITLQVEPEALLASPLRMLTFLYSQKICFFIGDVEMSASLSTRGCRGAAWLAGSRSDPAIQPRESPYRGTSVRTIEHIAVQVMLVAAMPVAVI